MTALSAPRTLAPDSLSKAAKKPVIEGFAGDKRVFQDGMRTFEVHVIKGLPRRRFARRSVGGESAE